MLIPCGNNWVLSTTSNSPAYFITPNKYDNIKIEFDKNSYSTVVFVGNGSHNRDIFTELGLIEDYYTIKCIDGMGNWGEVFKEYQPLHINYNKYGNLYLLLSANRPRQPNENKENTFTNISINMLSWLRLAGPK